MTLSQTPTTSSTPDLQASLDLVEIKPGVRFSLATLRDLLPDSETVLFFSKVYDLDPRQVGALLHKVLNTDLTSALFAEGGAHSVDLQDYLCGDEWEYLTADITHGEVTFEPDVPHGEILPQMLEYLEVTVASSIKEVAMKLEGVVNLLPGKQGHMVFKSMMTMNAKRPTLGDFKPQIVHARQQENLLILDVSGSMNAGTVSRIINDVVALSYKANAHMAIVSDNMTYWLPGSYGVDDVLGAATYGGTHYETLAPLFDRDWGTVITVADYDSSWDALRVIAGCSGRITQVIDVSLVNRPTYLAEVVGQLADEVRPILIGSTQRVLV
jgi:hypothetical protein